MGLLDTIIQSLIQKRSLQGGLVILYQNIDNGKPLLGKNIGGLWEI